jgi:hemolysin III
MVTGGLLYTAGAIVFAARRPDPRPAVFGYHEIWHAFMVAAAACHYAMIVLVLRAA